MAIQIPRLERVPVQQEASVGRVDFKTPDLTKPMQIQSTEFERLATSAADANYKHEVYAADTVAQEEANTFERDMDAGLSGPQGARYHKGNPIEAYNKLDTDITSKHEAIRERYKDASDLTKQAIEKKLGNARVRFEDKKITYMGAQVEAWESGVTNDRVELAKNRMAEATTHLDVNDPKSLGGIQNERTEIINARIERGLKNGTVTEVRDEQGNLVRHEISPGVQAQINKDVSESMVGTIETLSRSGDVHGAQFLIEQFGGDLQGKQKSHLLEVTKKDMTERLGLEAADKIKYYEPTRQTAELDKITDLEVRKVAMREAHSNETIRRQQKEEQEKVNYEAVMSVFEKEGIPRTVGELEKNKKWLAVKDNMGSKQREAVRSAIESPKESDPKAEREYLDNLFGYEGKSYAGMSPGDFLLSKGGLDAAGKTKADKAYAEANNVTDADRNVINNNIGEELRNQLRLTEGPYQIAESDFGKLDVDQRNLLTGLENEFVKETEKINLAGIKDPAKLKKAVIDFVARKNTKKTFNISKYDIKVKPDKVFDGGEKKWSMVEDVKPKGISAEASITLKDEVRKLTREHPDWSHDDIMEIVRSNKLKRSSSKGE